MSRKADPFKIGLFIVLGTSLLVAGLVVFGLGTFFRHRVAYALYFADSVNGLAVGSPVKFKGVAIGTVKKIQISLDERRDVQLIPVIIEVERDLIQSASDEPLDVGQQDFVAAQVAKGLRASLEVESFITGRLYVQFDYYTNAPPVVSEHGPGHHLEIPTISTGLSEFLKSLERVDLAGLSRRVNTLLDDVSTIVRTARIGEVSQQLVQTLESVRQRVNSTELKDAIRSLTAAADEARLMLADLRTEIRPVAGGMTNLTARAGRSMDELRDTLEELRQLLNPDSPLVGEVGRALEEFAEAARSVRQLADFLERNPQALLVGRRAPEAKP